VTLIFIKLCLGIKDNNNGTPNLYTSRYIQVSSGTLGVHALVALFASIVTMYVFTDENSILLIFLAISLYAWFVNGHIFKNALDTTMSIGLGISLLHNIVYVFIIMILVQVLLI